MKEEKEDGTPTDAVEAAPAGAARALPGALAHRRSTTVLARGTADPKGSAPGQASWDVVSTGVTRLPCPSPVEAPHGPVIVPVSMMPGAARE
jgi:hypothetical protein